MDNRNDDGPNEGRDFRENSGCFNPGEGRQVCDKRGPDTDGSFDPREREGGDRQFRDDRESRFEGDNGPDGFERREFDRDDSNNRDDEERRHNRRDD
uniref:Uncharacterized protein n=1 Tax=Panagrolaimus sp. ES5 TaxID=591445 RepID=A0AC34FKZ5_9BILA